MTACLRRNLDLSRDELQHFTKQFAEKQQIANSVRMENNLASESFVPNKMLPKSMPSELQILYVSSDAYVTCATAAMRTIQSNAQHHKSAKISAAEDLAKRELEEARRIQAKGLSNSLATAQVVEDIAELKKINKDLMSRSSSVRGFVGTVRTLVHG